MARYSHIVVGGGSAGSIVASRLSEDAANRVLLIEAGPDTPPGREPAAILDGYPGTAFLDPRFVWPDSTVTVAPIGNDDPAHVRPGRRYEQARVLGGGSAINGQLANRGQPSDYEEWVERGAGGWGWDDVLPYFRKLERDVDFAGPLHGADGPLPIRRVPSSRWPRHATAFARALADAGLPWIADQNGEFGDGHFPLAIANVDDRRVSAAMAWLPPAVRSRGNLTIRTDTAVDGLTFDGTRVTGVRIGREVVGGAEIILSLGAIRTPELLLREGIGPARDLQALGIAVRADRHGVGRGLSEHPSIAIAAYLPHASRLRGQRRHIMLGFRFSSDPGRFPAGDMMALVSSKSAWHALGERLGSVAFWINRPASETGRVRLASADPNIPAMVDFDLLSDDRDVERLMMAFRRIGALHASPRLTGVIGSPFAASYSEKVRRVSRMTWLNRLLTRIASVALDGPAPVRRWFIDRVIAEGERFATLMTQDAPLEAFVRRAVGGSWHASCSCRMGAIDDPAAVVDGEGRVYGVSGLRIVDASIFPAIPSANTNLPVMMAAEKISDAMRRRAPNG